MSFSGKASSNVHDMAAILDQFSRQSSTEFDMFELCFSMFTPDLEYENVNEMHLGS